MAYIYLFCPSFLSDTIIIDNTIVPPITSSEKTLLYLIKVIYLYIFSSIVTLGCLGHLTE